MKKIILFASLAFSINAFAQTKQSMKSSEITNKDESNIDFCYSFISCHQMLNSALSYNTEPVVFKAFLDRANVYLKESEFLFTKNKITWAKKIAPMKVEQVEMLFKQYEQFAAKETTLNEQEMISAKMWLEIVETTKNKVIVSKIIK